MDDVRGLFLGMLHSTTPAAVTTNKNIIIIQTFSTIFWLVLTNTILASYDV